MNDVTHLFLTYREYVRHLWNTYFWSVAELSQDWDLRDEFDAIARWYLFLSRLASAGRV